MPFDYYYPPFHFCQPKEITSQSESLGSILFGDRLYNSPFAVFLLLAFYFKLNMLQDKQCVSLCDTEIPPEDAAFMNDRIRENYMLNWVVDGLPAGRNASSHYTMGFELGSFTSSEDVHLHNHYEITILYHPNTQQTKFRVVGVLVVPKRYSFLQFIQYSIFQIFYHA